MYTRTTSRRARLLPVAFAFAIASCGGEGGTGPGSADLSVADMDSFVRGNVGLILGVGNAAFLSLTQGIAGGNVPGLTITDQGGDRYGVSASTDADGNGSAETSLEATATVTRDGSGNLIGVLLDVVNFVGPGGIGANGQLQHTIIGGGGPNNPAILVESDGMQLELPSGSVNVTEVGYTVDYTFPANPFLEGFIDFQAGNVSATIFFEANGLGGWGTRVSGSKGGEAFEFTVP